MNAFLTTDGKRVVTDFGEYVRTGEELADDALALANARAKCRAAYDSRWYERKRWDARLTADTDLTAK